MKKSPAIEEAFRPLRRLEKLAEEVHEASERGHAAELVAVEAQRKVLKSKMDETARKGGNLDKLKGDFASLQPAAKPARKRFMTNNTTIEKASDIMRENPRGLTILCDELVGLFVVWDREDHKDDRCFHLQGWNGYGGYTSDRIGRGTIATPQLCEVIFGGIQPSKLLGYLALTRNNIENDGLLQRFQLLIYPDEPGGELDEIIDEYPNLDAKDQAFTVVEKLAGMDFLACGAQTDEFTKIPYFHFSPVAQVFFNGWLLSLEKRVQSNDEEPVMIEHLAKYRSLMPSLALIFYLIELANGGVTPQDTLFAVYAGQVCAVPIHCAKQAAAWCDYLETHARRIYGLAANITV
jgi:hypothetical protein